MTLRELLARPVREAGLGAVLAAIRRESTLARGATFGSMLRDEIYCFARAGTYIERADNTARILDVKYYLLLPSLAYVGTVLDTAQWDNVLRSLSGERAYRWLNAGRMDARSIADFVILDDRFPRSLAFCYVALRDNLADLARLHGFEGKAHELLRGAGQQLTGSTIEAIFDRGLHEFLARVHPPQPGRGQRHRPAIPLRGLGKPDAPRDPPHYPLPLRRARLVHGVQRLRLTPKATAGADDPRLDDGVRGRACRVRLRRPELQPRDLRLGRGRRARSGRHLPRDRRHRGQGRGDRAPRGLPAAVGVPRPDRAHPRRAADPPAARGAQARRRRAAAEAAQPLGRDPRAGRLRYRPYPGRHHRRGGDGRRARRVPGPRAYLHRRRAGARRPARATSAAT